MSLSLCAPQVNTNLSRRGDNYPDTGGNPRKYKGKLLIKPATDNVKTFMGKVRETIRKFTAKKTGDMIRTLNAIIRGWANYHRHNVAFDTFRTVDNRIFRHLWDWAKRRHTHKGKRWLIQTYWFGTPKAWVFSTAEKTPEGKRRVELIRATSIGIERHIKIRSAANPFDPKDAAYFEKRIADRQRRRAGRAMKKTA